MATPLSLDVVRRDDGTLVLRATGELDLSNVEAFRDALEDALTAQTEGAVTVDLSDIDYLDSGAINALFAYSDQIQLIANPVLIPVLTVSGLADETTVERAER